MKSLRLPSVCLQPVKDSSLQRILRRCGAYYHCPNLFYQELWKQRLVQIGFRVLSIEKLPYHDVWDVRVCMKLSSQTFLLLSKAVAIQHALSTELLIKQLRSEIRQIGKDLGAAIKKDCITVVRSGAYFRASFIWLRGTPGVCAYPAVLSTRIARASLSHVGSGRCTTLLWANSCARVWRICLPSPDGMAMWT
jgi:hypothetical protein